MLHIWIEARLANWPKALIVKDVEQFIVTVAIVAVTIVRH
tara:strand:- start:168 stop:287 length:120 start_codon:yes stop_codon:yes gene_type:complete